MKTEVSTDKAHAVFSASGSDRWMHCPGSIVLSKEAPPPVESAAAKEGTEAHACLEFLLNNHKKLDAAIEQALERWNEEMVSHALSAVKIILDILRKAGPGALLECETKVDSSAFTAPGQFGTVDAAVVDEFGRLTVIDYKYGSYPVDPSGSDGKGNSQLVYYALGLSELYNHNFEDVELVIIQPRSFHSSGEIVQRHLMSMEDLLNWRFEFQVAVDTCNAAAHWVQDDKTKINQYLFGGSWCKFCPAASICPELRNKALKDARIAFSDTKGIELVPEPKLVPSINMGVTLDACDRLEMWISKVREHAFHILERGGTIEGYKLVDKRPQRKWADETQAEKAFHELLGEDAFTEPKLLSPAQIERIDHWLCDRATIKDMVYKHTVKESSGRTIAKDSDNRVNVKPMESIFTVIDVEDENTPPTHKKSKKHGKQKRINRA